MSETKLRCEHAIFTSIRTPMGEGYRIIAASRGLRPDEKQAITRCSPSHDSLCWTVSDDAQEPAAPYAAAFYPLPGGRLCVALSCYAGAEHTGRGGERVYTHNLVCAKEDFALCAYNPFNVLRSMVHAGLNNPQLRPAPVLDELVLPIHCAFGGGHGSVNKCDGNVASHGGVATPTPIPDIRRSLSAVWRAHVLSALLHEHSLIINAKAGWLEAAEALLLGLPGPLRAMVPFSAGLKFSVGRSHRLMVLHDGQGITKSRIVGRDVELVEPAGAAHPAVSPSEWLAFVERHWSAGDVNTLARRTSRAFSDISPPAQERIGRLYNLIDTVTDTPTDLLLASAAEQLGVRDRGVESEIAAELVVAAQQSVLDRWQRMPWTQVKDHWDRLCALLRQSTEGRLFAQPLIERALRSALNHHPLVAAEAALDVAPMLTGARSGAEPRGSACATAMPTGLGAIVDEILARLGQWARQATDVEVSTAAEHLPNLRNVAARWQAIKPDSPAVRQILHRCAHRAAAPSPR